MPAEAWPRRPTRACPLSPIAELTSNTYGHVLEQRKRQVAAAMDAVLGG
jgi:hypothetical protein